MTENGQTRLSFSKRIHLAGCNIGLIPKLLFEKLTPDDNPFLGWILSVANDFNKKNQSVIIDIKPRSKSEVFLCELDSVFGFSYHRWTPTMYRLKILYNDAVSPEEFDKNSFLCSANSDIIYTQSYLSGSFYDGQLIGTWNPPSPNPKNSLLLWAEAMTFFYEQVKKYDPNFLNESVKVITRDKTGFKKYRKLDD